MKRFNVTGVAKDKEYDLTQGKPGSKIVYFTANPNGEAEVIKVTLKPQLHLKKLEVCKDLSELAVKSRTARGNVLTKFEVKSITLKQKGHSTLGGRKVWFDADVLRVNYDEHGIYLGEFWDEDRILVINKDGSYYTTSFDLTAHFEDNILRIEKLDPDKVWSLIQWNGELKYYYGKRFKLDDANAKIQSILGEDSDSRIAVLSDRAEATFRIVFQDSNREPLDILMEDFIDTASVLSDIFAGMGMKIVLSGTDSLGFWFAERDELYDRAFTLRTTFIPFREHARLLGTDDVDEYIRFGGTLRAGEILFSHRDAKNDSASFRNNETTRFYIDTAIARNI